MRRSPGIRNGGGSPAYDLTPTAPLSIEQRDLALVCGDYGRYAHAENLLSQCQRFYLKPEEAQAELAAMEERVKNHWYDTARRAAVSEADCERIAGAFLYEGFRFPLERREMMGVNNIR